jgi:hypothetical protein
MVIVLTQLVFVFIILEWGFIVMASVNIFKEMLKKRKSLLQLSNICAFNILSCLAFVMAPIPLHVTSQLCLSPWILANAAEVAIGVNCIT